MEYRRLADLEVSILCLGAWMFGGYTRREEDSALRQNRLPRCGHPASVEPAVRIEIHVDGYARLRYAQGCQGAS